MSTLSHRCRAWPRQEFFKDLGDLDDAVYLFSLYQTSTGGRRIDTCGPWLFFVEMFRKYLLLAGVTNALTITASDLTYKSRFRARTDIDAAMECLSLLLVNDETNKWTDEEVQYLRNRLTHFYATSLEADTRQLEQKEHQLKIGRRIGNRNANKKKQETNAVRDEKIVTHYGRFVAALRSYERLELRPLLLDCKVPNPKWAIFKTRNIVSALAQKYELSRVQIMTILDKAKAR